MQETSGKMENKESGNEGKTWKTRRTRVDYAKVKK